MKRLAGLAGFALLIAGCAAPEPGLVLSGTVADQTLRVTVPTLTATAVNLDAGFTAGAGATSPVTGPTATATSTVAASLGLGTTVGIEAALVAEGDRVQPGQQLAELDTSGLRAQRRAARADRAVAKAQVAVLSAAISDTWEKAAEVADKRADVAEAIDQLERTRTKLVRTRAQLREAKPKLTAAIELLQQQLANYPPVPPPGMPTRAELQAKLDGLQAQLAKVTAGLARIADALPRLSAGLAKARAGRDRLADAAATITDARAQLTGLRTLAQIAAETSQVPVDLVDVQLSLARPVAPAAGVVTWVAQAGDQLAPGATLAVIYPARPARVTAWLPPARVTGLCPGDPARITADWLAEPVAATLTWLNPRAVFPPTEVATTEVHLTRAIELELAATAPLPAGLPVEVSIAGCRPEQDPTETDR